MVSRLKERLTHFRIGHSLDKVGFFEKVCAKFSRDSGLTSQQCLLKLIVFVRLTSMNILRQTFAFVSGAEGLRFESRAGQIEHSVANSSPPLRYVLERSCVFRMCNDADMGPTDSLHAWA